MLEKTKRKNKKESKDEKTPDAKCEKNEESNWSEDQKRRSYYYDDSHGYEIYREDEEQ